MDLERHRAKVGEKSSHWLLTIFRNTTNLNLIPRETHKTAFARG